MTQQPHLPFWLMAIGFIYSNCVKTFWTILSKNDESYSSKDTLQLLDSFYDLALNNLLTTDSMVGHDHLLK